jgi:hypothetical protein
LREATDLCGRLDWPRVLDTVGNRGFSGAAKAARGQAPQGAQALILMGDWCAAAQPTIENQVCEQLTDAKGKDSRARKTEPKTGEDAR